LQTESDQDRSADEEYGAGYGADPYRRPMTAPLGGRISLGLGHAKLLYADCEVAD
jgi:hypothetical protein